MQFIYKVLKICHCDVKPANILLINEDLNIAITDFGIARKLR